MERETKDIERSWTIELESKASLKNVTLANGSHDRALIEGTLGRLVRAAFVEGVILEVVGTKGTFRINLGENEIRKASTKSPGGI